MYHRDVTLADKYELLNGRAFMTGIQALVRIPLDRQRLDQAQSLNTAGFISGYRGSPLGGYDQQLRAAQTFLDAHNIRFWEGLNEDLGATAVWGSQQVGLFPGAQYDGVFGIWYGKAPGVDRSGDVFKHANFAGSAPHGGVLAVLGDDHNCKSSTLPSQSEYAMMDAEIPVFNPASIQDVLDYGLHALEMSRQTGGWASMIALADTMDSGAVIDVSLDRHQFLPPDFGPTDSDRHIRRGDTAIEKEARLRNLKLPAAKAYVLANSLNHQMITASRPRIGIIVTGQAARDVFEALSAIGLSPNQAADLGISILKIAMPWPLEPEGVRAFCNGLERVLVIEHKRPLIEDQLRAILYDLPGKDHPMIEGKRAASGARLLSDVLSISIPEMARALVHTLPEHGWERTRAEAYFARIEAHEQRTNLPSNTPTRSPHYCSGCPHNTSTTVPEGSRALAGIGCHYMATFMHERRTDMGCQMGGEGLAWIGQHAFTDEEHVFVNLGDGTYSHSGSLAIRAAVTAGANITYKILYNDAVAMTGGQSVESGQSPVQIAQQVHGEGVETIVIVANDPTRYANVKRLPRSVRIYHRNQLEEVQRDLRKTPGVSVLIYDQLCATEKRRRTKRGLMPADDVRVVINQEVCEGCGDCSIQSNCLSVEPVETDLGRKRRINQSTCNTDLSCLKGFCPSFVTVKGAEPTHLDQPKTRFNVADLPLPQLARLDPVRNIIFTGIGGTGVTTAAAILAMAAHIDGNAASSLDMTGLAQKGGPVLSHIRLAKDPGSILTGRVPPSGADLIIACDLVVAASSDANALMNSAHTQTVANTDIAPTSDFIQDRSKTFDKATLADTIKAGSFSFTGIDAEALSLHYLHDAIYVNMVMLGFAWQHGQVPVTLRGLYRAIKLNGVKPEDNMAAFNLGRIAAHDPGRLHRRKDPRGSTTPASLDEIIKDRMERLKDYQNADYANQYRKAVSHVRAREKALGLGDTLSCAVAKNAYKLMAYKDEYEVARLYTNGRFASQLADRFKGGHLRFYMAPPLFARKDTFGRPIKRRFGPWMLYVLKLLTYGKHLRGTRFDLFGYTSERRKERALRDRYLADTQRLADELSQDNHVLAVQIAELPDDIRGFGHVKEAAILSTQEKAGWLWGRWPQGNPPPAKTRLISLKEDRQSESSTGHLKSD